MRDADLDRIAGWAGIVFSVLSLIVVPFVGGVLPPPLGATGEEFATYYREHRLGFLIGNYLGIAAFVPGFLQLGVLARRIRAAEGPDGWLGPLVLATGTFAYAVFACSLIVFQALPFLIGTRGEVHAIGTVASAWFALDGLAAVPMVLAIGWAAREGRALPRALASWSWVAAVLALAMSFGGLTDRPRWLAGGGLLTGGAFVGFFAWTLALGVLFVRRGRRAA